MKRCAWVRLDNPLYVTYHDTEWGIPVYDDRILFEFIILEGAQAGLSWETILKRRCGYKKAFSNFNPKKVSTYTEDDIKKLMSNDAIIRHRLKIESTILNAQAFLEIQKEFGSFSSYIWDFVGNKPIYHHFKNISEIPAQDALSIRISKDLKKRGFRFVGPTIVYAFMQAVGLVNDHTQNCFKYKT